MPTPTDPSVYGRIASGGFGGGGSLGLGRYGTGGGGGGGFSYLDTGAGPVGTTLSGTQNYFNPAYGGVPGVPNPAASAGRAIQTNLGNLGGIYNLTTGLDTAGGAGAIQALEQEIPGVSGAIGSSESAIQGLISGKVPGDVIAQLQQQAGEIGAGRGLGPMAPATNAEYLKALGLTSIGLEEQGLQAQNALMTSVPRPVPFDPSSMLLNPQSEQEWQYLANVLANAPQPAAAAQANIDALRQGIGGGQQTPRALSLPAIGGVRAPGTDALGFTDWNLGGGYPNLSPVGAINPSSPYVPTGAGLPPGLSYGAPGWRFDPDIGGYVNPATGQISDTPGGQAWEGFSASGVAQPALTEEDLYDMSGGV